MHAPAATEPLNRSSLWNPDLAPVPRHRRTWSAWHIAALWIGMAVCIPTYSMASNLIATGMNWWQALLVILLGNVIVLVPMLLNAHPGTAYGIPFPVLLRASFGTRGANIAALMRGIVACGWFGIQTWIGGSAIYGTLALLTGFEPATAADALPVLGISAGQFACFLVFWAMNVWFIVSGMESIKWLEALAAPFLLLVGIALMIWAWKAADGFGPLFSQPSQLATPGAFWPVFVASLTAQVGFWATLSLNIPDFSRYAKSQQAQITGQAIGLPPTMVFYSFIGVAVTSATIVVFGEAIWDPVQLIARFDNPALSAIALLALAVATLSTNIAANVVSPANDFANLAPRFISFRAGGLITAFIGILMFPWKLYADPKGYIFIWLIGYSALLGPIAGVMIADYFVVRRRHLEVDQLYAPEGIYSYWHGFGLAALGALALGILPSLPGFLATVGAISRGSLPPVLGWLYDGAWFVGFAVAFLAYLLFRRISPAPSTI